MFEKVNPSHPDKVADRIAGAIVDYAYTQDDNPKIAVEVLVGHNYCHVIAETSIHISSDVVTNIAKRITKESIYVDYLEVAQDKHLAFNQEGKIRCGDNGIFKGVPITKEQAFLSGFVRGVYEQFPSDGKYIINDHKLIMCQSKASKDMLKTFSISSEDIINPLGDWTGGVSVDTGATNRKLGSDMGDAVTGGGLHGKDLSKADVSVNIYAHLKAQETGNVIKLCCAIGDEEIDGKPYEEIVDIAKSYIKLIGGFEKLAEWGLI